jgi:hypothetical protein
VVGDGPDIGYDARGLRDGAGRHRRVSETIDGIAASLSALGIEPAMFGRTPSVARFAAGTTSARDLGSQRAWEESERRLDAADRTETSAELAEHLTSLTTDVAGSVPVAGPADILTQPPR